MTVEKVKKIIEENERVYFVYTSGIYRGQIIRATTIEKYLKDLEDGDLELHHITTTEKSLQDFITVAKIS